jgi:ubiquitin-like modifier-activating enzyme ATG7
MERRHKFFVLDVLRVAEALFQLKAAACARPQGLHNVPGQLRNVNTIERFKALQEGRSALLAEAAAAVWADICSGAAEADPALLSRFLLISYADLKLFRYYYW